MSTPRERGTMVDGSARHRHEHADPPSKPHHDGSPHGDEHGHGAHDKHAGHDPEMFRRLFWWNLALAVPVLVFSVQIQEWFGYSIDRAWAAWPAPVLGTVILLWGGQPFLKGAVAEVRDRQPGMMLLIALAITVAYVSSLAASLSIGDLDFWWELAALIVVMSSALMGSIRVDIALTSDEDGWNQHRPTQTTR